MKIAGSAQLRIAAQEFMEGILFSYSQIFFLQHKTAAWIILISSFFMPGLGFWGVLGVTITHILALLMGFDRKHLRDGLLGLNGILVAMALAAYFQPGLPFFIILLAGSMLTLLLAIGTLHWLGSRGLPFLSIPFLIASWTILLSLRGFTAVNPSAGNIFFLNDLFSIGGKTLVDWYLTLNNIPIPEIILGYFKSLSAIIFQYNWMAGLAIALALLFSSRITFLLSITGYLGGYLFYLMVGAIMTPLYYSYIGFNFILMAIALGGFFFIPSWRSFLLVIILMPVLAMLVSGSSAVLANLQLPVFSLPFVAMVLVMMYASYFTTRPHLQRTLYQQYLPERNLYAWLAWKQRFRDAVPIPTGLPFLGEWTVVQGQDGKHTHKGPWKYAWDFAILGPDGKTFRNGGHIPEDYWCYQLPVVAPAWGRVIDIIDHLPDNPIGEIDLKHNWGNAIVLEHGPGLYSQISHLKAGSFKVSKGDVVTSGQVLASLGNSGRSPEPHLHFQFQATPDIGSPTLPYPLGWYLEKDKHQLRLRMYAYPTEGERVLALQPDAGLQHAFGLHPGKMLAFKWKSLKAGQVTDILITRVDPYNKTYLECLRTGARAYVDSMDASVSFTSYQGSRDTALYHYYLALFRTALTRQPGVEVHDTIPLDHYMPVSRRLWQDFFAPFRVYKRVEFHLRPLSGTGPFDAHVMEFVSSITTSRKSRQEKAVSYRIRLDQEGIVSIALHNQAEKCTLQRCDIPEHYENEHRW